VDDGGAGGGAGGEEADGVAAVTGVEGLAVAGAGGAEVVVEGDEDRWAQWSWRKVAASGALSKAATVAAGRRSARTARMAARREGSYSRRRTYTL
jgi:hypothetical protein